MRWNLLTVGDLLVQPAGTAVVARRKYDVVPPTVIVVSVTDEFRIDDVIVVHVSLQG
jgi:hypothetical protein